MENRKSTRSIIIEAFVKERLEKILKQVEYESARRERHINEKTRKRDEEGSTFFFMYIYQGNLRELTQGNLRELKGTQRNLRELKGTQSFFKGSARRSNRRKKTQEKGQRGKL